MSLNSQAFLIIMSIQFNGNNKEFSSKNSMSQETIESSVISMVLQLPWEVKSKQTANSFVNQWLSLKVS